MDKILVVDDSRMILEVAKDMIEGSILNTQVIIEHNPLKVKEILLSTEFQLVILDIVMPNIDGIELLKWIKSQDSIKNTKVIMFTSLNDSQALSHSFEIGAYDFITKPLKKDEFLARIKHAIIESKQEKLINRNYEEMLLKKKELELLNKKIRSTQAELLQSERLASIGYLAAGIAHEINNPLGFVKSNFITLFEIIEDSLNLYDLCKLQYNLKEEDGCFFEKAEETFNMEFILEEKDEIKTDLDHGIRRIEKIINALRNFSQIDSIEKNEFVEIREIFNNVEILTKDKFINKISVSFICETDLEVYCKKGELNIALMSVLLNASEAVMKTKNQHEKKILVKATNINEKIVITISDNGIGMDDKIKKHVFDPFFTTKEIGEGTGLGLTTAYNCITNNLKGTMKVESEVGEGTSIIIEIPVRK